MADLVVDPWFTGYETTPRWLRLTRSSTGIRSVAGGFELQPPDNEALADVFHRICGEHPEIAPSGDRLLLGIPQRENHGIGVDTSDRVVAGADLLREFVAAGL